MAGQCLLLPPGSWGSEVIFFRGALVVCPWAVAYAPRRLAATEFPSLPLKAVLLGKLGFFHTANREAPR